MLCCTWIGFFGTLKMMMLPFTLLELMSGYKHLNNHPKSIPKVYFRSKLFPPSRSSLFLVLHSTWQLDNLENLANVWSKVFQAFWENNSARGTPQQASSSYAACSVALAIHLKSPKVIGVIGGFRQKHWWFGSATFSRSEAWWFLKLCN